MGRRVRKCLSLTMALVLAMVCSLVPVWGGSREVRAEEVTATTEKATVEVWDFGAEQFAETDKVAYVNHVTVDVLTKIFDTTGGTHSGTLLEFNDESDTVGSKLVFHAKQAKKHRLVCASNSALSSIAYKADSDELATGMTGKIDLNTASSSTAYFELQNAKAGDKLTVWCDGYSVADNVLVLAKEDAPTVILQQGEVVSNKRTGSAVSFYIPSDGTYRTWLNVAQKGNYSRLSLERAVMRTVTGTVTGFTGAAGSVEFTNEKSGVKYSGAVQSDGTYSVNLPALMEEVSYKVSFSDTSFAIATGGEDFSLSRETAALTRNIAFSAVSTCTVTGSVTGFDAGMDLTGAQLSFTTTDQTDFVPTVTWDTAAGTYTATLATGVSYTAAISGANDYAVSSAAFTAAAGTQNITVAKKPVYTVGINLGAGPDFSTKTLAYVFTHADGSKYTFADKGAVKLRDGTYSVAIEGDFEQFAYKMDQGTSLTVSGANVSGHVITFAPVTAWQFTTAGYGTKSIEGTTGYYQGLSIDATAGKLAGRGADAQFNQGTKIKVPVDRKCSITVTVNGGGQFARYTIGGTQADTSGVSYTYEYTGAAGNVEIVSTGTSYLKSITVVYPAKEVEYVPQTAMPFVPESDTDAAATADADGKPRGGKKESIIVQPEGQKLLITQTGGAFAGAFASVKDTGYYLFPMTADSSKLEFDLLLTRPGSGNSDGFFGGIFTNNYMYTLGLRSTGKIRGIYSKNGGLSGGEFAGAGSPAEEQIVTTMPVHYVITLAEGKAKVDITYYFAQQDGSIIRKTASFSQGFLAEPDDAAPAKWYFGFGAANINATVTNMVYAAADGTVLYNQNDCYHPAGTAPVAEAGSVTAAASSTREYIDIAWRGTVPAGDGTYVVEMRKDSGEWTVLADDVAGFTYRYTLSEGEGGSYLFRVCGQLGKAGLGGTRNTPVAMSDAVSVLGALSKPVVTARGNASDITLTWTASQGAEKYVIYRYSSDDGAAAIAQYAQVAGTTYTDKNVTVEVPYYYVVKAVSLSNESPASNAVWAVATPGHSGPYVYEDAATQILITKKSYDTVFNGKAVLEGVVLGEGTLVAQVGGEKAAEAKVASGGSFAFALDLAKGRNDVNLLFTDGNGKVTRKTYNFVYLTAYDMVVDASYAGTDGAGDVPTYKTVQAAVNVAPAQGAVILVLAGSYEERLEVDKPNITLIGEDREKTSVHIYPGKLGQGYEAGGDMALRCATYIKSNATNFTAENISFANDYVYATADGKSNKSADAIRVEAENSMFVNVKLTGVQDTLYMHSGTQYYYKCRIEGLVDFIYSGDTARAFFNDCEIVFVYENTKTSGYVCAPKTAQNAGYGLTFYNCSIVGEEGCAGTGYLLARPWGPDAYITWINCYMGRVLNAAAPYSGMSGNLHENARFYESGTYGPGFAINPDRRQISPAAAANMIKADYLGWDPVLLFAQRGEKYVGDKTTERRPNYVTSEASTDKYQWTDGNDAGLKAYDMEGYAASYAGTGVNGGGLLKESSPNYYKAATAAEFLTALTKVKQSGKNSVIELTADINLGSKEVADFDKYGSIIKEYAAQPLTHPTLIESGVSVLTIQNMYNLTIFSSNASSIKHANITMKNSGNIIIRNIKFDELWEWDEATGGDYDRNDWDYMTIDSATDGVWIDHCTFYKAYDGVIDVKNPSPKADVTISWCEFLPGSEDNIFFDAMMKEVFDNPDKYPTYVHMKEGGMTDAQVRMYAYGQKKTHLFGQDDSATSAAGIQVTLANNYYKNSMDRMPRLRYGYSHVYNCIMDAQELLDARNSITNEDVAKKIVSNGASSTCGAQVLLENCYINGIQNALNSGNGASPSGYINAINSVYYMGGTLTKLEPKCNTTGDTRVLVTDAKSFIVGLPYSGYHLYDANKLDRIVTPHAGAGKLTLTSLQWEKVSYNAQWKDIEVPKEEGPTQQPTEPSTEDPDEQPTESSTQQLAKQTTQLPAEPTAQLPAKPTTQQPAKPTAENPTKPTTQQPTESTTQQPTEPSTQAPPELPGTQIRVEKSAQQEDSANLVAVASVLPAGEGKQTVFKNAEGQTVDVDTVRLVVSADKKAQEAVQTKIKAAAAKSAIEIPAGAKVEYMDLSFVDDSGNKLTMEDGKVQIILDYPAGTDGKSYTFMIVHGLADGSAEVLTPVLTDRGLLIEAGSLSPFALVYTAKDASQSTGGLGSLAVYLIVVMALAFAGAAAVFVFRMRKTD